jgi:hypothetical protein
LASEPQQPRAVAAAGRRLQCGHQLGRERCSGNTAAPAFIPGHPTPLHVRCAFIRKRRCITAREALATALIGTAAAPGEEHSRRHPAFGGTEPTGVVLHRPLVLLAGPRPTNPTSPSMRAFVGANAIALHFGPIAIPKSRELSELDNAEPQLSPELAAPQRRATAARWCPC